MKNSKWLLLVLLVPAFQNCSAPQADAVPTAVVIGPSSSNLSSLGSSGSLPTGSLPSVTVLNASYTPNPLAPSGTATISVSNGTGPYTFRLLQGAGQLTANTYAAPATPEVAVVAILDAVGNQGSLMMIVQPDTSGANAGLPSGSIPGANSGAGAIQNPFAGQTAAQISNRSCSLAAVSNAIEIENGIYYEFCLIVARFPDANEFNLWYNSIMSQAVQPDLLPKALFESGILQQKYHIDQMSMTTFIIFMSNQLVFRNPTTDEGAQLMAVGQSQGQEAVFNAIMSSPAFAQANPLIPALKQKYQ